MPSIFSFYIRYNRILYTEMICTTLKKNNYTILPTPFSSVSHTYKPNKIFSSYSLQYIFSFFIDIIFIFMKCSLSVKSLSRTMHVFYCMAMTGWFREKIRIIYCYRIKQYILPVL